MNDAVDVLAMIGSGQQADPQREDIAEVWNLGGLD
jgi:hypothetical protein